MKPRATIDGRAVPAWRRFAPVAAILAVSVAGYAAGLHRHVGFAAFVRSHAEVTAFVADRPIASVAAYLALYVTVVALSLPGAAFLTLVGGLLFGAAIGAAATVAGATCGAVVVFLAARTACGDALRRRAGPLLARLAEGFRADAFNYLLFLRLVPLFPFWLVNLAPALFGMRLGPYALATAVGILPGTVAFSVIGSGLGGFVEAQVAQCAGRPDCHPRLHLQHLVSTELLLGFAALGVVALIPVVLKARRGRGGAAMPGGGR